MPKDKTTTLEKIIPSAKKEFLQKGFANASMRNIAAGAGISAAGLYNHFENKEAMFEALVAPVYEEFLARYRTEGEEQFDQLPQAGMEFMWNSSAAAMDMLIDFVYTHLDEFRLLIMCSEQSPFEKFTHTLIEMDIDMTEKYLNAARSMGYKLKETSREELHFIINAEFSCIVEMVRHEISMENAKKMARRFEGFFTAGWKNFLMEPSHTN